MTWRGTVAIARSGRIVLAVAFVPLVIMTVLDFALGFGAGWFLLATTVLLALLVATCAVFRVRVSAEGLRVRSAVGWPNTRIPLADIAKVEVVRIQPFAEFGGWGWRIGLDGRRGVVMRTGEALQVTRANGRVFVVTVDGAAEAADALRVAASDSGGEKR